jgi:hypothetical protein
MGRRDPAQDQLDLGRLFAATEVRLSEPVQELEQDIRVAARCIAHRGEVYRVNTTR